MLVITPQQYTFLGHLRVNLRLSYIVNTYPNIIYAAKEPSFQYDKDLCRIKKLCSLQDLRTAVFSQRLI